MEEKIGKLIDALVETVRKMDDRTTRDSVSDNPGNLADAFRKTESQKQKDSNKEAARLNAEENARLRKKEEEEKGRKILAQVTPVNITSFDQKALKQLASISPTAEKTAKEASKKAPDTSGFEFMDILKGLGYAFVALVVAPIVAFFAFFKEIGKQKWFIALKNMLKAKFWEPIKKFFKPITDFFTRIKNSKFVKSMITVLDDIWIGIKKFGKRVKDFFKPITRMFTWIGNLFGGGPGKPGVFMKIMNFFNPAKNPVVKGILTFAKGVGSTLGKLFLPITIIMGVIDGVMGFMKGYEEKGDLLGGIQGALTGVVNGLIMLPLDILKDGLSWILELVGLEGASAWLDSFSFQDLFGEWMDIIFCNVRKLWDNLTGGFTDIWDAFFGDGDGIDWGQALKGFMKIVTSIPAYILDILKDGISGILSAFGVDTTWLDSFDIMDIVNDTIDWFIGGITGIVNWFKLLFTEPSKAFKKIGDWFDKLWDDPIGTIKDMLPEWMWDVGKWVWDHTLGPIVDLWTKMIGDPEGAKKAIIGLMPEWLQDIAGWVWDRTLGPILEFWNYIFGHPDGVKAAFKSLVPEWLWDIGEWVYDHTIGPIVNFFGNLFDDPVGAIKELIPQWMLDVGGWLYDKISPLLDWFDGVFDWFSGEGMMKWAKENLPEKVYDALYGEKEKQLKHEAEQAELLKKTGQQATTGGGRDYGKEMEAMQKELQDTFTHWEDKTENGGKSTGISTSAKFNTQRLKADIKAKGVRAGSLGSSSVIDSVLEEMYMKGRMVGADGKETELSKKIRAWKGTGTVPWQAGYELTDANREQIAKIMNARMYADESFGDDVLDSMDEDVEELGLLAAKMSGNNSVYFNMFNNLTSKLSEIGGIPLGSDFLRAAIHYDDDVRYKNEDGEEEQGRWVVKTLSTMLNPAGVEMAKKYLDAYKNAGGHFKPEYEIILGHVMDSWGWNHAAIDALGAAYDPTGDPNVPPAGINLKKGKKLDDFIMRPGQDPVAFNKGDILLGIHKDNPPATGGSPELINRVDQMVITLKENKDLQAKMLEAMVESGMMDKQGNTVVNNGGNSTVVNNTTVESNIMSFRDRAVGRISNSSTKY